MPIPHTRAWELFFESADPTEFARRLHSEVFVTRVEVAAGYKLRVLSYGSSLNGLKTFRPGRRKSRSLPVTIVSPWRLAVAAM